MNIRRTDLNPAFRQSAPLQVGGSPLFKGNTGRDQLIEIPKPITGMISSLKKANTIDEAYSILDNACENHEGFKRLNLIAYSCGGFQFYVGLQIYTKEYVEKIKTANNLQINSSPEFVDEIDIADQSGVVVTYHHGSEKTLPVPYKEVGNQVTQDAKYQFFQDMQKLALEGYVHPFALRGPAYWHVNSLGNVVLDSWNELRALTNDAERADLIRTLNKSLKIN